MGQTEMLTLAEQAIQEAKQLSDRELLEQIYARLRMVDSIIETAQNNPMLQAFMP